jgi:transposase
MLERIAKGETEVAPLVGEARGALRKKKAALEEALAGWLPPAYQMLLKQYMEQVRLLWRHIDEINQALKLAMREHALAQYRLCRLPGVDLAAAEELLAEIGPTASAFPTAEQFASWVGICQGSQESAGVNYSKRSAKGNRYLRRLLCQIAWAAVHTKETFFASLFARLKPRIAAKGAVWAVGHRIAKLIWRLLHEGADYQEKGPAALNPQTLLRKFRRLVKDFHRLGIEVPGPIPQPAGTAAGGG